MFTLFSALSTPIIKKISRIIFPLVTSLLVLNCGSESNHQNRVVPSLVASTQGIAITTKSQNEPTEDTRSQLHSEIKPNSEQVINTFNKKIFWLCDKMNSSWCNFINEYSSYSSTSAHYYPSSKSIVIHKTLKTSLSDFHQDTNLKLDDIESIENKKKSITIYGRGGKIISTQTHITHFSSGDETSTKESEEFYLSVDTEKHADALVKAWREALCTIP